MGEIGKCTQFPIKIYELTCGQWHDKEPGVDSTHPPKVLNLDGLAEAGRQREERSTRKARDTAGPNIQVHLGGILGDVVDLFKASSDSKHNVVAGEASRKRTVSDLSDDDDDAEAEAVTITEVLQTLNRRMPALKYMDYEDKLRAKGIAYANAVGQFDRNFYEVEVGMQPGSIGELMRIGKKLQKGKSAKIARIENESEKENVPPTA